MAFGGALSLALAHPLWPALLTASICAWTLLAYRWPRAWLLVLPAAMPALNFAPWTGWIGVDEFDAFVLATVAAGYAKLAYAEAEPLPRISTAGRWVLACGVALVLAGIARGLADAGGWPSHWYEGQADALNSIRVGKSLVAVGLLWPLLRHAWCRDRQGAFENFARGMQLGAAVVVAAVLWERASGPGLFNVAAPYRTVGPFWEMHVGGAAIDAYVALCTPFVAWGLLVARGRWSWGIAAALALLWVYVGLTTFSRGAYFGAAVSLLVLGWRLPARQSHGWWAVARMTAYVAGVCLLFALALDQWGYAEAALALVALCVAGWLHWRRQGTRQQRALGSVLLGLALIFEIVLVLGPDSYMNARLARTVADYESRAVHWRSGIDLLHTPTDWLLGLGAGRLPAHYDREAPRGEFSGAVMWQSESGNGLARITGPRSIEARGGRFGLTQRVPIRDGNRLHMNARSDRPAVLLVRVCQSHLLYDLACMRTTVRVEPPRAGSTWQSFEATLTRARPFLNSWPGPGQAVLTLSVVTTGASVDLDNLTLWSRDRETLLRNGDFSDGLASWLPAAQTYFVPWHIDNLFLEVLIEWGGVGLLALLSALGLGTRSLMARRAEAGEAVPCLAAAISGVLSVGLLSSVIDVPRVALLLWLLLVMAVFRSREPMPASRKSP
jgi:hypothetical protein